jgi:superfamily II DNA/RNA helicase
VNSDDFEHIGADPFFAARLRERGISLPTEIQRRVMPRILGGENLLFSSAPGTGKTFACLIPLLRRIFPRKTPGPGLLICAPTHELCAQLKGEVDFLIKGWDPRPQDRPGLSGEVPEPSWLKAGLFIGAASAGRQIEVLKKDRPAIIAGNPSRLLQLARMGKLRLDSVEALVLDEGDRLVADELRDETEALVRLLPGARQSVSCSATVSAKSRERLLPLLGKGAVELPRGGEALEKRVEHWAFFAGGRRKIGTLRSFLTAAKPAKALVFTCRAGQVGNIVSQLQYHHLSAGGIHGGMDKGARKSALTDFRKGHLRILVASDLACRGLDIEGISHVVALDVPEEEAYLHRAGRTGRAGRRGIMVSLGDEDELRRLARIEKKLGILVYPKALYGGRILPADQAL